MTLFERHIFDFLAGIDTHDARKMSSLLRAHANIREEHDKTMNEKIKALEDENAKLRKELYAKPPSHDEVEVAFRCNDVKRLQKAREVAKEAAVKGNADDESFNEAVNHIVAADALFQLFSIEAQKAYWYFFDEKIEDGQK